jgi:hypothetical protein
VKLFRIEIISSSAISTIKKNTKKKLSKDCERGEKLKKERPINIKIYIHIITDLYILQVRKERYTQINKKLFNLN